MLGSVSWILYCCLQPAPLTATASTEGTKGSPPQKPKRPTPAKRAAPKTPDVEKDVSKDLKIAADNKTTDEDRTKDETPHAKVQPEETDSSSTPESVKEQPERESNDQGNNLVLKMQSLLHVFSLLSN